MLVSNWKDREFFLIISCCHVVLLQQHKPTKTTPNTLLQNSSKMTCIGLTHLLLLHHVKANIVGLMKSKKQLTLPISFSSKFHNEIFYKLKTSVHKQQSWEFVNFDRQPFFSWNLRFFGEADGTWVNNW